MQMGTAGYKALMDERRENYKLLKEEMTKVAEKYGERVLETRNNPISIGKSKSMPYMKLGHLKKYFLFCLDFGVQFTRRLKPHSIIIICFDVVSKSNVEKK